VARGVGRTEEREEPPAERGETGVPAGAVEVQDNFPQWEVDPAGAMGGAAVAEGASPSEEGRPDLPGAMVVSLAVVGVAAERETTPGRRPT
jgi:hypothetical protein